MNRSGDNRSNGNAECHDNDIGSPLALGSPAQKHKASYNGVSHFIAPVTLISALLFCAVQAKIRAFISYNTEYAKFSNDVPFHASLMENETISTLSFVQYSSVRNNTAVPATKERKDRSPMFGPDGAGVGHFFSHVPKSGGTFFLASINALLCVTKEWQSLPKDKRFAACNAGFDHVKDFRRKHRRDNPYNLPCTLWKSEQGYSAVPAYTYTIVREPREHVLSEYFHCEKDPDVHVPPLDTWLDLWVDALNNKTRVERASKMHRCYNPINYQTKFLQFDPQEGKEGLKKRYDFIGINKHMDKSVCAIFIKYTGWVPTECNCSSSTAPINNGTLLLRDVVGPKDWGVNHHGYSYNTTQEQDKKIKRLRELDLELYPIAVQTFFEQVKELESEYKIKLCDKIRFDPGKSYDQYDA